MEVTALLNLSERPDVSAQCCETLDSKEDVKYRKTSRLEMIALYIHMHSLFSSHDHFLGDLFQKLNTPWLSWQIPLI